MSENEKEGLHAANKCLICREVGHATCSCPNRNKAASSSGIKSPGLYNYNIEITSHNVEYLGILGATTEGHNSLGLGMIHFEGLSSSEGESDQIQEFVSKSDSEMSYLTFEDVEDLFEEITNLNTVSESVDNISI